MQIYSRPIRFEDVDAARIVFFANYVRYAHEAMEDFFRDLDGGYCRLITERGIGLPAVHLDIAYSRPLRYGDVLRIETTVDRIGTRSAVLRYRMIRAADDELAAELVHTVVLSDLHAMRSCDMPEDVRAILTAHLAPTPSLSQAARSPKTAP